VERTSAVLRYDRDNGTDSRFSAAVWASKFSRYSKRQNGSGFGIVPTGTTNTINLHEYYTYAGDIRYRTDYGDTDERNTFTIGTTLIHLDSPIYTSTGATPNADTGTRTYKADRESRYASLFAENVFRTGKWTFTPGVRIESIRQSVIERQNNSKTNAGNPLATKKNSESEPLFAIGATYDLGKSGEYYANISEGYKPMTYSDAVPTGANDTISDDLEPANVLNYEIGRRGRPAPGVWYDVSLFAVDYDGRFGRVGSNIQNVGRSINYGASAAVEVDLWRERESGGTTLTWHGNVQLLDAEFISGPLDGKTPQYAPDVMLRSGLVYRQPGRAKVALLGTYLSEHFADDGNTRTATADWLIPSYVVFDLTAEFYPWRGELAGRSSAVALLAGVNNLLDEKYHSRVRSNGIDPAAPRNYYAGVRFEF
jgi:Fe(3+) dicitrate transport protein